MRGAWGRGNLINSQFPILIRGDCRIMRVSSDENWELRIDQIPPLFSLQLRNMLLVTGSAGHLGANLVRRLLNDGEAVRVLLRKGSNNGALDGLDVEPVFGDLRDPASLKDAVRGCDRIH